MSFDLNQTTNSGCADDFGILKVSDISRIINNAVVSIDNLQSFVVEGEIASMRFSPQRHLYFSLKDGGAEISCVMFAGSASYRHVEPAVGMSVICRGQIAFYKERCQVQIIVRRMALAGIGEGQRKFEMLRQKLTEEGLFRQENKQKIPRFVGVVGVVTSPTGAVIHDVIKVARQRYQGFRLQLCPVSVQGEESPLQIARAIELFNRLEGVDVIIVGRGGGSNSDLEPFNSEVVVRAIYASKIPIVSAVGHETDITLCDAVADVRAATPSHAAEIIWPDKSELQMSLKRGERRLQSVLSQIIKTHRDNLNSLTSRPVLKTPDGFIQASAQKLDGLEQSLLRISERILAKHKAQYQTLVANLEALSPLLVLKRGYTIISDANQVTISQAKELEQGKKINISFFDGLANATINNVEVTHE